MRAWITYLLAVFLGATLTAFFYEARAMVVDTANAISVGSAHLLGEGTRARVKRARDHAATATRAKTPPVPTKVTPGAEAPPKRAEGPVRPYVPPEVKDPDDPVIVPQDKLMADLLARTNDPAKAEKLAKKFNALSAEQQQRLLETRKARRKARRARLREEQDGGGKAPPRSPDDPDRSATGDVDEELLEDTALPLPDDAGP